MIKRYKAWWVGISIVIMIFACDRSTFFYTALPEFAEKKVQLCNAAFEKEHIDGSTGMYQLFTSKTSCRKATQVLKQKEQARIAPYTNSFDNITFLKLTIEANTCDKKQTKSEYCLVLLNTFSDRRKGENSRLNKEYMQSTDYDLNSLIKLRDEVCAVDDSRFRYCWLLSKKYKDFYVSELSKKYPIGPDEKIYRGSLFDKLSDKELMDYYMTFSCDEENTVTCKQVTKNLKAAGSLN